MITRRRKGEEEWTDAIFDEIMADEKLQMKWTPSRKK